MASRAQLARLYAELKRRHRVERARALVARALRQFVVGEAREGADLAGSSSESALSGYVTISERSSGILEEKEALAMVCPSCGVRALAGQKVCSHCGEYLVSEQLVAERPPEKQAEAPAVVVLERLDPSVPLRIPESAGMLVLLVELGLALVGLIALLLGWGSSYLAFPLILGIIALVGFLFVGLEYWQKKQAIKWMRSGDEWMRLMRSSDGWMGMRHWTYTEQEWQLYTSAAWKGCIAAMLGWAGVMAVFLLIVGLVAAANAPAQTGNTLGAVGSGLVAFFLPYALSAVLPVWHQRRQPTGDAYVGLAGIILGGWCISSLNNFDQVAYQSGHPAVLRVRTHLGTRRGRSKSITEVPVPREHEAEAQQFARDFAHGL